MENIEKVCAKCEDKFEGTKRQKICIKCRKENKKAVDDAWRLKNPKGKVKTEVKSKSVQKREKIQKEADPEF